MSAEGLLHPALERAETAPGTVLVRGARLLDPRSGLDREGDVLVRGGRIAELGEVGRARGPGGL